MNPAIEPTVDESLPTAPRRPRVVRWSLALMIITAVVAGGAFALKSFLETRSRNQTLQRARSDLARGDFTSAAANIAAVLKSWPRSAEAHYLQAKVDYANDRLIETAKDLGLARDFGFPTDQLEPFWAALTSHQKLDPAATEDTLRRAMARPEPQPEAAGALARIYLESFRLDQAAPVIERWMKDAPYDARPYLYRIEIKKRSDADPSFLIRDYREALRRDPKLAKARLGLAEQLRAAHRLDESLKEYNAYIALCPNDPDGHIGAAQVLKERGGGDSAATEAMLAHLDQALRLAPSDAVALKERGTVELRLGHVESARGFLEKAIKSDPFDPDSRYQLSRALKMLGEASAAKAQETEYAKLRKEHDYMSGIRLKLARDRTNIELRFEAAKWLLAHAHDEEGLRWTDQILQQAPNHAATLKLLADYYNRKGDAGRANYYENLLKQAAPAGG